MSDLDFLEAKVRGLELENRQLRASLWDQYFCAAITSYHGRMGQVTAAQAAAGMADQMMARRKERYGQPEKMAKNEGGAE